MLELNNVCRLEPFRTLHDFKLNLRTFLQAAVPIPLNCRKVDEYIFATLPLDKTIALAGVKPLHSSLLAIVTHFYFYSF